MLNIVKTFIGYLFKLIDNKKILNIYNNIVVIQKYKYIDIKLINT